MHCFDAASQPSPECFEAILQTMAEGVLIIDVTGVIRFCNHGLEKLSGYPAEKIVGKRCGDIMVCACGSMKDCSLLSSGALSNIECQLRRADGSILPVLKNGRTIADAAGAPVAGIETITDISSLKRSERTVAVLQEQFSRNQGAYHLLIGKSPAMQQVFELIGLAAVSSATVMITGESGTGKELAARAIHAQGPRSTGPLVKVNCSALPETLLESELFGHARGSFTGAIKDKIGRFEAADGGTLFIDEIGEVSPLIQVKLLRFFQEREFERVGESVTRKADVRIIAATNRDLRASVRSGEFREDLYYRLKVFPIHLPPLRDRKEDVGMLISHFIAKFNKSTGKSIAGLTHEAALTLMDYCWPGNIRELENAIEHAFVTCKEQEIGIFDLPLEIRRVELRAADCAPAARGENSRPIVPARAGKRRIFTKEEIASALERNRYSYTATARSLDIDRTTLWRLMRKLGMQGR
jgi:PAS domain S-box-containing protein